MVETHKKEYFGALDEEYENPFETGKLKTVDTFYVKYIKRILDIIISFIALLITLPINLVLGIITFFDVGSPIFFSHERPGLAEKPFRMVKFRNMTNDVDEYGNLLPPDQRITKWGKFARESSLDELLQFWLIFIGKMSVIGPRPLLMAYLPRYSLKQHKRHAVKPGLECPLPHYTSANAGWDERIANDVWYVEHIGFKTDCMMFGRLIKLVFNSNRAKVRGEKIDEGFHSEMKTGQDR